MKPNPDPNPDPDPNPEPNPNPNPNPDPNPNPNQGWFVDNLERQLNASRERMAGVLSAVVAEHAEGTLPDDGSEADLARDGHVQDAWPE